MCPGFTQEMLQITRTFAQPSPIQAQCWPIVMSGRDLVGIAATGSGKTLAFGLPALRHLLAQRQGGQHSGEPFALALCLYSHLSSLFLCTSLFLCVYVCCSHVIHVCMHSYTLEWSVCVCVDVVAGMSVCACGCARVCIHECVRLRV